MSTLVFFPSMMVRSCLCVSSIIFILTSQNNAQAFFHVPKKTNGVRNSDSYVLLHRRELFGIVANQGRVIGDNFCVPGGAVLPASGSISSYGLSPPISGTRLHAVPQKRIARRDLKKRPNRRGRRSGNSIGPASSPSTQISPNDNNGLNNLIVESEVRPLVRAKKVEAGEDYWIDEAELQKSLARKIALKNRKASQGEISKEKLKTEVVAPYKQNWIGLFSVGIIVLATIVTNFPELLNSPVIQIPDL